MFHTRGFGACARAHPPGVAPEALEGWFHSFRGFSLLSEGFYHVRRALECEFRSLVSAWLQGEPPSLYAKQEGDQEFPCLFWVALAHPFRSEGGVEYARLPSVGASSDTSDELLLGKSEWRPVPHSIGVS